MYNQAELEKKERRKIVIFAVTVVALILALIVAIVVAATSRSAGNNIGGEGNAEVELSDNPDPEKDIKPVENKEKSTVATKPTTEQKSTETAKTSTTPAPATEISTDLPKTGPEDFLYLALVLGLLTASGTAFALSHRTQTVREN